MDAPLTNRAQEATVAPAVRIRQFASADAAAVAALFTEGMCSYEAHQDEYNLQYIASCLKADLADIEAFYIAAGGNFWVATMPTRSTCTERGADSDDKDAVVGMVGLERRAQGDSELRRLSVKRECQGLGIGRLLVEHLEQWARASGVRSVSLSTGVVMNDAILFYTKCGYTFVKEEPEADDYTLACFVKEL